MSEENKIILFYVIIPMFIGWSIIEIANIISHLKQQKRRGRK